MDTAGLPYADRGIQYSIDGLYVDAQVGVHGFMHCCVGPFVSSVHDCMHLIRRTPYDRSVADTSKHPWCAYKLGLQSLNGDDVWSPRILHVPCTKN